MDGCLLRTCKSKVWISSLVSNVCCYERKPYTINTTISSTISEDGCAEAVIECVEETPSNAKMVLSLKNYCEDYATRDQLEEIKDMMLEIMKAKSECREEDVESKDDKEDPKVLLIGPDIRSDGKSEVLSLPDLKPLDCNIPVFPGGEYDNYVGRATTDGVFMCGGRTKRVLTSSCYLLTRNGYQEMPGLIQNRFRASSVVIPSGLWVTGGENGSGRNRFMQLHDTTEIWSNNQSQPHVRLPKSLMGHCWTSLNNTHLLLTGGHRIVYEYGYKYVTTAAAYIYSEMEGFTRIEDMKTARQYHGCSVINDNTVVVAGGYDNDDGAISSTEYFNLNSLKWSNGPELPENVSQAKMLGPEELGPEVGGHLLIGKNKIFKLADEGLTHTRHWIIVREMNFTREFAPAFVVNQNMFC